MGKMGLEEILLLRFRQTQCSNRSGTGNLSSVCRSRWPESFGVEDRGHFYDPVGALRDVVVNHLLQVVAATAMEAPSGGDPETLKSAQLAVFRAVVPADPGQYVRGQYDGYRAIDGVQADSTTETYTALRLDIENWRLVVRRPVLHPRGQTHAGEMYTEVRLVFKRPPKLGFRAIRHNRLSRTSSSIKLDPTDRCSGPRWPRAAPTRR